MMISANISQFWSLDGCPFYKLHGLIHVFPPFADMVKYLLRIHAWFFFLCDEMGNAHMSLSPKVLSTNICAWNFYLKFDYFCSKENFECFNLFQLRVYL